MEEKRIKIKSKISLWQFILISLILIAIVIGIFILNTQDYMSSSTRRDGWELIGFVFFIIPLLYSTAMSKKEYLSDIYITNDEIKLVYKIRDKITKTKIIKKNNIKTFELNTKIDIVGAGKYKQTDVTYKFFIDLIEGKDIYVSDISDITLIDGNYKFIYRILDAAKYIPNFKLNLTSNNDIIKAEIDYYKRFGRTIPFTTKFKMEMNKYPRWLNIILGILIICLCGFFINLFNNIFRYF